MHLCSCRQVLNRLLIWCRKKDFDNLQERAIEFQHRDHRWLPRTSKETLTKTIDDDDDLPFAKAALASPWHRWALRRKGGCSSCSPDWALWKINNGYFRVSLSWIFFGVCLTLDYDYVFWNRFYIIKCVSLFTFYRFQAIKCASTFS